MSITGHNIFGATTSTGPSPDIPYSSSETTAAGKLIDKMKNIADNAINKVIATTDWLGTAADSGQRDDLNGLVRGTLLRPTRLSSSNILTGWTNPAMPTLPAFPTLPPDLKLDFSTFKTNVDQLVVNLQNSWMAHFLPTTTDTSRYDVLFRDILNGSDDSAAQARLNAIYTDLKAALAATMTSLTNDITTQIATMRSNLNSRKAALQPKIDAAIAAAGSAADIAFTRARDQAAREGLRLESEAIAEWAGRGFSMPGGVLTAQQAVARQATLDAASKIAAEEAIRTQEADIEFAKISIDSWMKAAGFDFQADLEAFKTPSEVRLKYAAMEMDANRELAKTAFDHLGLRLDFTKFSGEFALKYRVSAIEGMNGLINAYASLSRNEMEYYARIAEAQRANLTALVDYYRASLANAELGFRASITNNDNDVKWAQVAANFIGTAVGHHVASAQTTGQMYASIAAQALSGLNAVSSQTVTG